MDERPTPYQHPRLFAAYYAGVLALAAGLFLLGPGAAPVDPLTLALVLGLMLLIELYPVALPMGGYATASAVVDLPCLVLFGPWTTAALSAVSVVLAEGLIQRKAVRRVLHNVAIFAITDFVAGGAFHAAGGRTGTLSLPTDLQALLAMSAVYFLSNAALASTVVGLTAGPSPWRVWERNFQSGLLHHLSFVALGLLVTITALQIGAWAVVLFAVPLFVAQRSFRRYTEIRADLKDFVRALSEVLEEIDPYTRHHSVRVSQYAVRLARGMRLAEHEVEDIECAALVHDLGKIGPEHQHILRKPGALSHEEQRTLRAHPAAGAEIVGKVRALRRASEIVRSHHERPDGQGYPYGLRSEDVPVGARILKVSDAFDAMTSDRPYRRALDADEALRELQRGAGTQFDAAVVECLVGLHRAGHFALIPSPSSEDLLMLSLHPARARR
jgi:putative nucleotidyltransferase with HDIG domain